MPRTPLTHRVLFPLTTLALALALPISAFAGPPTGTVVETAPSAAPLLGFPPAPELAFARAWSNPSDQRPRPEVGRNHGLGWTIMGFGMFGTFYVLTACLGTVVIDNGNPQVGQAMLVPVVGPFIGAVHADRAGNGFLLASSGVFQLAGLAMGITGAVMLARARKAHRRVALGTGGLVLRF